MLTFPQPALFDYTLPIKNLEFAINGGEDENDKTLTSRIVQCGCPRQEHPKKVICSQLFL